MSCGACRSRGWPPPRTTPRGWPSAQEAAGLDIVTDGEIRRESYSNRFATALDGVDLDTPGVALDRSGEPTPVPRIVGPIRRINADGMSVLLVEQNVTMALQIASRAYVLEEGRIVADGAPAELLARPEIQRAYLGV